MSANSIIALKQQYLILSSIVIALFLSSPCQITAHENNIVHSGMTNAAITLADIPEITARGFFDINTHSQCSFIDEGSVKEDHLVDPPVFDWDTAIWGSLSCGVGNGSWMNHAYNPINGQAWSIGGEDTITYAVPLWQEAITNYANENWDDAYFILGRICHLLEDMTSPAHTHSDVHATGDDFEDWGEVNFSSYNFTTIFLMPYIPSGMVTLSDATQVPGHSIEGFLHS